MAKKKVEPKKKTQAKKKGTLKFNPHTCCQQYRKLQDIAATVCDKITNSIDVNYAFNHIRFDDVFDDPTQMRLFHDCTWWDIPTEVVQGGVDAIIEHITAEHKQKLEKYRRRQERARKDHAAQERERDIREYRRLKAKLKIGKKYKMTDTAPSKEE